MPEKPLLFPEQHLCVRPTASRWSEWEGQEGADSEARTLTWGDLQAPSLPAQL